jgi:hypothetical protein
MNKAKKDPSMSSISSPSQVDLENPPSARISSARPTTASERLHSTLSSYLEKLEQQQHIEQEAKVAAAVNTDNIDEIKEFLAASYRSPQCSSSSKNIFSSDFSFIGKATLPGKKSVKKNKKKEGEGENENDQLQQPSPALNVRVYAVRMSRLGAHMRKMKVKLKLNKKVIIK